MIANRSRHGFHRTNHYTNCQAKHKNSTARLHHSQAKKECDTCLKRANSMPPRDSLENGRMASAGAEKWPAQGNARDNLEHLIEMSKRATEH